MGPAIRRRAAVQMSVAGWEELGVCSIGSMLPACHGSHGGHGGSLAVGLNWAGKEGRETQAMLGSESCWSRMRSEMHVIRRLRPSMGDLT